MLLTAALVGGTVAATTSTATAQQRDFANPLVTKATTDLDITGLKIDATTSTITTRLSIENVAQASEVRVALTPTAVADESMRDYVVVTVDLRSEVPQVRADRVTDGELSRIPDAKVSARRDGDTLETILDTDAVGTGSTMHTVALALDAENTVRYAARSLTQNGVLTAFGPVTTAPDTSRLRMGLSSSRQAAGRAGTRVTLVGTPAVPGRIDLYDGATRLRTATTGNGSATLVMPSTLKPGTHRLRAVFTPADALRHQPSQATGVLTVVPAAQATRTTIRLSKTRQVYRKNPARITVAVTGRAPGTATVYDGARRLGTVRVTAGRATYTVPRTLKPGVHRLRALFIPRDREAFGRSSSGLVRLKVTRR
jgi:hypothetical protein